MLLIHYWAVTLAGEMISKRSGGPGKIKCLEYPTDWFQSSKSHWGVYIKMDRYSLPKEPQSW